MFKFLKRIFLLIFIILLAIVGSIIYSGYNMYDKAINNISIEDKVKQIKNEKNYTNLENIPQKYVDAVISVEDHRFYEHSGIDFISIARAIFVNIQNKELEQGGSTIAQQLAKNMYFSQEKLFSRKIAELFIVYNLEKNYSKDDILELYVNTIYFGRGYTGIGNASIGFFNKAPSKLTDYEATYLAGLPKAPSIYSAVYNSNLAEQRHKVVLNSMVKYNKITKEEADKILNSKS